VITAQSKQNVEIAFHKAVRANLTREAGDVCDISPTAIGEIDEIGDYSTEKLFFITLSSFVFRLVMIFRIAETQATLDYYIRVATAQTLEEVFAEVANMCGGMLNRELSASFPHLAMSTPCTVSGQCITMLDELKPQYVASYQITINDAVKIQSTLCLCCSTPVEFAASAAALEGEDTVGELELF
jgi:hypothetical protein